MIKTEAWVLYEGASHTPETGTLVREEFSFPDITEHEVLAEPIYGCWEANMSHALERKPIDICRRRGEEKVVIGNAGVVRILKTGAAVTNVKEGDLCCIAPIGTWDKSGFPLKIVGYDAPNTIGLLAKRVKLHEMQVAPIPKETKFSLKQWAAFSLRFSTAWSNWKVAYGCWQQQRNEDDRSTPHVWGWGGGVTLAELMLAKFYGCQVTMIASGDDRLELIKKMGVQTIDRRLLVDLDYDENRYSSDRAYKKAYVRSEKIFLNLVKDITQDSGVSIFIDNIGTPTYRATLRALGRQAVITTTGWKHGMMMSTNRAIECINRHIHVHTHACKYSEGVAAMRFAEETGWIAPVDNRTYDWDQIPQLTHDYTNGKISSYFPIFQVNPI